MSLSTPKTGFYVYTLSDDTVFYVGKGAQYRIHAHEKEARTSCWCPKCMKIRSIWARCREVQKAIVFVTSIEDEACQYERQLIAEIGRGNLLNRTNGGEGKQRVTEEERQSRAAYRKDYQDRKRAFIEANDPCHPHMWGRRFDRLEAKRWQEESERIERMRDERRWAIEWCAMNNTPLPRNFDELYPDV